MAKDKQYDQIKPGKWYNVPESEICCDCGLTHKIQYRIKIDKLQFRCWIDEKFTRQIRKTEKFECVKN